MPGSSLIVSAGLGGLSRVSQIRSEDLAGAASRDDSGLIDMIFPLFDAMAGLISLPRWLTTGVELIAFVQAVMGSLWLCSDFAWHDDSQAYQVVYTAHSYAPLWPTTDYYNPLMGIVCGVVVFEFGWLLFEMVFYIMRREFARWTLYMSLFITCSLPLLTMAPMGTMAGALAYAVWVGMPEYPPYYTAMFTLVSVLFVTNCVMV